MVSPLGDRNGPQDTSSGHPAFTTQSQADGSAWVNSDQMFRLIDSVLPFEACLYHQVLPLSIEGSRLNLGMVNPDDTAALDYVRRILAYINCSLVPRRISAEMHQKTLSSHLNQANQKKQAAQKAIAAPETPAVQSAPPRKPPRPVGDRSSQPTLIVDSPETLEPTLPNHKAPTPPPQPPALDETLNIELPTPPTPANIEFPTPPPPAPDSPESAVPSLDLQVNYISSPIEVLATLPPKQLLDELLGRILVGGIGRLYFERQQNQGRILWSQNGVLQSVLEKLPAALFQGVILELKRLTHLPMIPVQKPRQADIERLYQDSRLLLRFRVMPGTYGEEATLQVLRGAALKFYQQQQLATLSRDALGIAQQLQRKLDEIRDRAQQDLSLASNSLEALPALNQLLQSVDQQLKNLSAFQGTESDVSEPDSLDDL